MTDEQHPATPFGTPSPEPGSARQVVDEMVEAGLLDDLMDRVDRDGLALTGAGGFLPELVKAVLERGLAAELTGHLGYEKGDRAGRGSPNSRNGSTPKTVGTEVGDIGLDVPRDRNASFEPRLVPKGSRRLGGLDEMIISLKNTARLGTRTAGAGPYMLDAAATVAGDHYTFVQNPNYYDKASVHWKKVVVRAITNPQATLNAMKTGQVDFAVGDASTLAAAKQAGLVVTMTPLLWTGVTLADRAGTMSKPLADVRVRQALNYATDRKAISSALFPDGGRPTSQLTVPGGYGYDAKLDDAYPYDVDRAKQLLAEAGYPTGFSLKIVTAQYQSMNLVAQALAQQWRKVGVILQITDRANANQYFSEAFGAKYPAFMTIFGQQPIWTEGPSLFLPSALFNPFHTADPKLQSLYDQAAKATGGGKDQADREVRAYLVHQAWFVPVVATGLPFYTSKKVTGASVSPKAPLASIYELQPAA